MAKPSEWTRTTTAVAPADLAPAFTAAIEATAERERIIVDPREASVSVLTRSERTRRGFLRSSTEVNETALLLTGELLIVAVKAEERAVVVSFLRLDGIEVRTFSSPLVDDIGIEVIGVAVGATERASRFIPLDDGGPARSFRVELDSAIAAS